MVSSQNLRPAIRNSLDGPTGTVRTSAQHDIAVSQKDAHLDPVRGL